MKIEFDEQEILKIIDDVVKRTMKVDFTWDWPCGVAFYGICRAWEVTKNQTYIDDLRDWVDEYIEIGLPPLMINSVAMGHMLITLYEATGDEKYWKIALEKAEYLEKKALRFGEGVFQHTVSLNNDFPEQAWADTLFMAAYFLLRMGYKTNNQKWIDDALNQYYWHETYLQDDETNTFYHAWNNCEQNNLSGIHWARANGWAALTMAKAYGHLNYLNPMWMQIGGALGDQLSALVRIQSENGLWHTILDDSTSYEETSASAAIASALITWNHPLHYKYVQKAIGGILSQIKLDGTVKNVSAGTAVMLSAKDYKRVPIKRIQGWGQGLTLDFLATLLESKKEAEGSKSE